MRLNPREAKHMVAAVCAVVAAVTLVGFTTPGAAADYATKQGLTAPGMWWLDVEKDNSWSRDSLTLNRYAIQGAVDFLRSGGRIVGIYSNSDWWNTITGGTWSPSGVTADWVGTVKKQSASAFC